MTNEILSKTLTTGANGMVGSYVDFGTKIDRQMLDITNLNETLRIIRKIHPKAIIHLAAETDLDLCERDPQHAYLVNSIGTYNIATAAKEVGAKLVYISTSGIFDGTKKAPYIETDKPNPQNFYGRSKFLGEIIVKEILDNYIIARACWMFGGGLMKDQKFVAKIVKQLKQKEIKVVNDRLGSPTFGRDLVESIKTLILEDKNGIFHLSNKGVCTRYDMAVLIAKVMKSTAKIVPVDSNFFQNSKEILINQSMESRISLMRPWQDALEEYLKTEWRI